MRKKWRHAKTGPLWVLLLPGWMFFLQNKTKSWFTAQGKHFSHSGSTTGRGPVLPVTVETTAIWWHCSVWTSGYHQDLRGFKWQHDSYQVNRTLCRFALAFILAVRPQFLGLIVILKVAFGLGCSQVVNAVLVDPAKIPLGRGRGMYLHQPCPHY